LLPSATERSGPEMIRDARPPEVVL
jgi:hypothetical protein